DIFSAARDIFYASGILLGTAAGMFAGAFLPEKLLRQRSRNITASLYILSAAVVLAGTSLCIFSDIIYNQYILILVGIFCGIFFFAFFFPVVLRFAVFAVLSALILSTIYFYQIGSTFNNISVPIAYIKPNGTDSINIKAVYNKINIFTTDTQVSRGVNLFYDSRYTNVIKYSVCYIAASGAIPVFGGRQRVILLSVTMEQTEPGRSAPVFWTKPMEETLLGSLLSGTTELLNSAASKVFMPSGRGILAMQIIYGKARLPSPPQNTAALLAVQKEQDGVWREKWR
ncbi:MAG: hypothetical protein LBD20_05515, partial [Spirochaetaceae bacterium]|nr:hypothetical protein [Spirochaetaceae bacterium]